MSASQLPIYVINLQRRPDRLAHMARQLDGMKLAWTRWEALDATLVSRDELAPYVDVDRPMLRMSPGSWCCLVSNVALWQQIAVSNEPAAIILQDDVVLAPEFADFARSASWLEEGIDLVQLEKYGRKRSTRLLGKEPLRSPSSSIEVRELYSRTGGAGAYVISRDAARRAAEACRGVRFPVDHYLFNANISPAARHLRIAMTRPSVARQQNESFESDIQNSGNRTTLMGKMLRAWYEVNLLPRQIIGVAAGRMRLMSVWYDGS